MCFFPRVCYPCWRCIFSTQIVNTNGLIADKCQIFVNSIWFYNTWPNTHVPRICEWRTVITPNFNEIDFNGKQNGITFASATLAKEIKRYNIFTSKQTRHDSVDFDSVLYMCCFTLIETFERKRSSWYARQEQKKPSLKI